MRLNKEKISALSPTQQEVLVKKLQDVIEYKRENPLYFYNHPEFSYHNPKQLEFHSYKVRFKALFGGNQSGKTTAGIADDLIQAVDSEVLPDHLKSFKKWEPPFYWRIFTPDLGTTMDVVQEKMKELCPASQLMGGSWEKAYDKLHRITRFKNGSWCLWNSYDQELPKLGAVTLHRIHFDEEPFKKIYEESIPRLVRYDGDFILTMTPLQGMSWTYHDIWRGSGGEDENYDKYIFESKDKDKVSVVMDIDDNPVLTEQAKYNMLKEYGPELRKARKQGRFVHFAGLIYSEFNPELHIFGMPERPFYEKNVNVVVGIDPGLRYACAVLWAAIDSDGLVQIFDELYLKDHNIADVCEMIKRYNVYHGVKPVYYVIDPHAKDRSAQTGRSDQSEYTRHGINTIPAQNAVETGINMVKEYLRDQKLRINYSCKNLIGEFGMYRWKDPPKSEEEVRAEPIKQYDHALDALRYILMSRPYLPKEQMEDNRTTWQKIMEEDRGRGVKSSSNIEYGGIYY